MDIVSEKDSLTGYRLVIVPALYVLTEQTAANLEKFAAEGGTVVFTLRTGVKDEYNAVANLKLPGRVSTLCGLEVEECVSLPPGESHQIHFELAELAATFSTFALADVLAPKGAQVIARHTQDFYAGKPVATLNHYGKGKVIYLGVLGDGAYYDAIVRWLSDLTGLQPELETPAGVEVAERWQGEQRILCVLNHTAQSQTLTLNAAYKNVLTDQTLRGEVQLEAYGVLILTL